MLQKLNADLSALREATREYAEAGRRAAQDEARYQSVKATRALEMRAQGESAAMINLLIKGDPTVNDYLMQRECSKALYEATKEQINTLKLSIRIIENQIEREWKQ